MKLVACLSILLTFYVCFQCGKLFGRLEQINAQLDQMSHQISQQRASQFDPMAWKGR